MRRMFLRAYAQQAWGLTHTMSYADLAMWLTGAGYPTTTTTEVKNAARQKLAENVAPRTDVVLTFASVLQAAFPAFEVHKLLIIA